MNKKFGVLLSSFLIALATGCATSRNVSIPSSEITSLPSGTPITIHLRDGTKHDAEFTELTDSQLVTSDRGYSRKEIRRVTQRIQNDGDSDDVTNFVIRAATAVGLSLVFDGLAGDIGESFRPGGGN